MTDPEGMKTEWAEERTVLAVERTYASWLRTGMGAVGVAIGLHVVFGMGNHGWAGRAVATLFLVIALAIFAGAERQVRRLLRQFATRGPLPQMRFTSISLLFIVATVAVGVLLWSL